MDPHIRGTGAGDDPEPTRRNIPGLGSIYRRGDRSAIEFWKDGVRHRESARTSSEQEAIAHLRRRVKDLLALKADPHKLAIFPHNGIAQTQKVAREPIRKIVILRKGIRYTEG